MPNLQTHHNANLSMTLTNDSFAVNSVVSTYPCDFHKEELAYSNTNLHSSGSISSSSYPNNYNNLRISPSTNPIGAKGYTVPKPSNPYLTNDLVYLKIDNNIFNLQLKVNVIEYYILLTYMVVTNPKLRLTIHSVIYLMDTTLNYKISKNSVSK
jgi:hypothetical protein